MLDKERLIKEKRTIEATKKNLLGPTGKVGCIAKYLGEPIRDHDGGFGYEVSYLPNFYDEEEEDEENETMLPEFDNVNTFTVGFYFDGLKVGMNIEIKYLDETRELSVQYKGYLVFSEVAGDLRAYNPTIPEWEDKINKLYKLAKTKREKYLIEEGIRKNKEGKEIKQSFLNKIKKLWGV